MCFIKRFKNLTKYIKIYEIILSKPYKIGRSNIDNLGLYAAKY